MAEYYGKDAYIGWIYSGGTAVISGNYRTVSDSPSVALIDITAGNDASLKHIVAHKSGQVEIAGLHDTGGTIGAVAGTAALQEGAAGTLLLGPEGTVAGKPKTTIPATCMGIQLNVQYNNATEFSISFTQNGDRTYGVF